MAEVSEELEQKVLYYLGTVSEAKIGTIAKAVGESKMTVGKALAKLADNDKVEYIGYGGSSAVKLKRE